jgi:hypothetical protein
MILWEDGRKYRGSIVNGKMEGAGRFIDKNGKRMEG